MARCLTWIVVMLIALPAFGEVMVYELVGDESTLFPTDGTLLRPGVVTGTARIDESGAAPVLEDLSIHVEFAETIGGMDLVLEWMWRRDFGPAPGQSGTGSTADSISWGTLTGWAQTGILVCPSQCFLGDCDTACLNFVGFAGTGPISPLKSTAIDPGAWTFSANGASFDADGFEFVNLAGGIVTESVSLSGTFTSQIPVAPLAAFAALGGAIVFAAALRLRRPPDA